MSAILKEAKRPPKVIVEAIPAELKALKRWVGWRYEWDGVKRDRPPLTCLDGRRASSTDPATWSTFDDAVAYVHDEDMDGIGFMFGETDPYAGVDLDNCRDPETGKVTSWAAAIVRLLNSYTEISPSGTGIHVIVKGALPTNGRNKRGNVEFYDRAKYFTMTGQRLERTPNSVVDRREELVRLHSQVFESNDHDIIERATQARDGGKFRRLWEGDVSDYPSTSEADLALCGILAYWTYGDARRIERLFGESILAKRGKWQSRKDYRRATIQMAIAGQSSEVFTRGTRIRQEKPEKTDKPRNKHTAILATYKDEGVDPPGGGDEGRELSEVAEGRQGLAIQLAVELAIDHGKDSDWKASFKLARQLRTLAVDNPEQFESAVEAFCEKAGRDFEPLWYAFLNCWDKVRHAEGEGELVWAADQAEKSPFLLSYYPGRKCDQYKKLASIAYHLSCLTAPGPFWLTRERVAPLLGCKHPMEVTRLINLLEKNGVIECVDDSYRYAGPNPKAKEYRFIGKPMVAPHGLSPVSPVPASPVLGVVRQGR